MVKHFRSTGHEQGITTRNLEHLTLSFRWRCALTALMRKWRAFSELSD